MMRPSDPTFVGASFLRVFSIFPLNDLSVPSRVLAVMVFCKRSRIIIWSIVGPITMLAFPPHPGILKLFSGETDGPETRYPVFGSVTSQSMQNCAASFIMAVSYTHLRAHETVLDL